VTVDFGGDVGCITDDSREAKRGVRFLLTRQNEGYSKEALSRGSEIVTPKELYKALKLGGVEVVGVTGTNGKTTTTAALYSILLDLGYGAALQGTRGLYINDEVLEAFT